VPRREAGNNMTENEISKIVVDSALTVHKTLGPGLLEMVYEVALAHELEQRGLPVQRQAPIPVQYKGIQFQEGFRADIIVGEKVILELKTVEKVSGLHKKQLQTYLKLTGLKLGFLLNFNEELMKLGITRCANGVEELEDYEN
jgi:GxxExxY protein